MLSRSAPRLSARLARRPIPESSRAVLAALRPNHSLTPVSVHQTPARGPIAIRAFHSSKPVYGILPDVENPPPKESEPHDEIPGAADITAEEYHQLADDFFEKLLGKIEQAQELRSDVEAEYAAGVLNIEVLSKGTYVLNKQPPNKQIWLSSPVSGPKRYDWVVLGDAMNQKEGGGTGEWIYLRDGSSLTSLLKDEVGVDLAAEDGLA